MRMGIGKWRDKIGVCSSPVKGKWSCKCVRYCLRRRYVPLSTLPSLSCKQPHFPWPFTLNGVYMPIIIYTLISLSAQQESTCLTAFTNKQLYTI